MLSGIAGEPSPAFELAAIVLQAVHHFVEAAHQRSHLIISDYVHTMAEVALAYLAGSVQQRGNWHADLLGQQQCDPGRHEQNEQGDQQQKQQIQRSEGLRIF